MTTPAFQRLRCLIDPELLFVQVMVQRVPGGYSLRHGDDRMKTEGDLRRVDLASLRGLAMFNASGVFRPLRCAPDLIRGWVAEARDDEELERALEILYPGCVADWNAAALPNPPVTHFREFVSRQSGMYRITNLLNDDQAARVASSCCDARFCLRRRLWTIGTLEPDAQHLKSAAPCLEPCAVLLELARKAMRLEQEEKSAAWLAPEEWRSIEVALERLRDTPPSQLRTGDVSDGANPRRIQLLLENMRARQTAQPSEVETP